MTREKHRRWLIELLTDRSGARDYYLGDEDKKVIVEALKQPETYNLEAVVGQLEAIKKDRFAWCALHNMKTCEKYQAGCVDHLLDEIIKLVKAGGRND